MTAHELLTALAFVLCVLSCKTEFVIQPEVAKGSLAQSFADFVRHYGRPFQEGTKEYAERYEIFSWRVAKATAHNSHPGRLWTAGINSLSDRSDIELAQLRGLRGQGSSLPTQDDKATKAKSFLQQTQMRFPDEFLQWNNLKSLQRVKDQKRCGSCWAVATVTVLEAHADIHEKKRTFSAQELVSCVDNQEHCGGDGGCEGATVELALNYMVQHGLSTEMEWPYAGQDITCKNMVGHTSQSFLVQNVIHDEESMDVIVKPGKHTAPAESPARAFGLEGWQRLPENSYNGLIHALVNFGPVAISVAAGKWNDYTSGVFDDCGEPRKNDTIVDHAATLVGYGKDESLGVKYYLIQNSWTKDWGENGRLRLLRRDNEKDHCTRDTKPEVGTGCREGVKEIEVCGTCGILYDSVVPHFKPHAELSWDVPI
jgi:hypothetical protein